MNELTAAAPRRWLFSSRLHRLGAAGVLAFALAGALMAAGMDGAAVLLALGLAVAGVAIHRAYRRARQADGIQRRDRTLRVLVITVIALFAAAVLVNLFVSLRRTQQDILRGTQQNAVNLARVLEEQVGNTVGSVDFALGLLARNPDVRDAAADQPQVRELLAETAGSLPPVLALWRVDARGDVLVHSGAMPSHAVSTTNEYLQRARRRPHRLFIDRPMFSDAGELFIPVSRAVLHPDGRFAGVVAAALRPDALGRYSKAIQAGRDGFVGVVRSDGVLMQPLAELPVDQVGQPIAPAPPFVEKARHSSAGTYRNTYSRSPVDRLVAYRRVEGRPLVVLVAFGVDEVLAPWRRTAAAYLAGSLLLLLLVTALGLRLLHELRQRETHESRIDRLDRTRAVLSGATSMIMRAGTRSELFDGACRVAVRLGQFGVAWVDVFDPDTGRPRPVASAGEEAAYILQPDPPDASTAAALVDRLATQWPDRRETRPDGPAVHLDHSPRRLRALQMGYRSSLTLPLTLGNEVVAGLTLLARPVNFFDADEIRLLDDLADDLSHALDHLASLERIQFLAMYDELTGLPNRTLFIDRTLHSLQTAQQDGTRCAMVKLDIERFRHINTTIGRDAGDRLIRVIGERMAATLSHDGLLSRPERDHFMFLLRGLGSEQEAASAIRQALHACFDAPFHFAGHELHLSARAGIALFPGDGEDPDTLLTNAEAALARAKHTGERMTFYTATMNARAAEALDTENRLRGALDRDQFVLHYQPKFDARTGELAGLEGLIRWQDDPGELVPPARFVPLLEETGLILPVGEWVMQQALRDHRRWRALGFDPPRIAVNVSALQLRQDSFARTVHDALEVGDEDMERALELEITESMLMSRVESSAGKLDEIRGMGVHIAIDDFGTGYSSLQYIAKLPLDTLKIDRSFVTGMTRNTTDREIVASVISLAHQLHLKVVAEGVESPEQARILRELDCDEMQGFLFSPPLPRQQVEALMRRGRRSPLSIH